MNGLRMVRDSSSRSMPGDASVRIDIAAVDRGCRTAFLRTGMPWGYGAPRQSDGRARRDRDSLADTVSFRRHLHRPLAQESAHGFAVAARLLPDLVPHAAGR